MPEGIRRILEYVIECSKSHNNHNMKWGEIDKFKEDTLKRMGRRRLVSTRQIRDFCNERRA